MRNIKVIGISALFMGILAFAPKVFAYSPNLSVTSNGSGNVVLTINNAYPNSSIQLSYTSSGSSLPTTISNFGTTDGSGNFTTTVSSSSYGLAGSGQIYVTVGGQQSNVATVNGSGYSGCGLYGCSTGGLTLSQTSVSMNVGQYTYVTAGVPYLGSSFYISNNSNSGVVTASVSGSQITLYGVGYGSSTVTVCASGGSNCGYIYVTVNNSGSNCGYYGCSVGGLTLSQTSVSLSVGQTSTVTASMPIYNPSFYVSSSNSGVVTASVSGSQISLYGLAVGSSTVTVCVSGGSTCGTIYVTVSGVLGANTNLWFSPGSANLYVGQSLAVSINSSAYNYSAGSYGTYYQISSNSNPSVVSASVSGSVLNLYANQNGTSNINVCSSSLGFCGTLTVTVGGGSVGGLTLSQTSLSLNVGQTSYVTASMPIYNPSFYVSSSNSGVVSSSVSGSQISLYGLSSGSATVTVCVSGGSACGYIYVTVSGGYSSGSLTFSPSNPTLSVGQTLSVSVYGNYSSYGLYVASNSNSNVATVSASGNTLNIYGSSSGTATINICTNGGSQCGYLYVTVSGYGYGSGTNVILNPSSLNLAVGQSGTAAISNTYAAYYGTLYISNNSSPTVVSATISGSSINVYGQNPGTTTLTICQTGFTSGCDSLYVTVSAYGYGYGGYGYGGGSLSLNQTNVSLSLGQTSYVTAVNYGSSLYVSGNSNSSSVTASASGNQVTLYGAAGGSSTITVCANGSQCGTIYVTVSGGGSVRGASAYNNGALISENGTVYIVYKNTKTGFTSVFVFRGLGFSFNNVVNVGNSGLSDSGYVVSTAYASHPWGSWIKSGQTVYFVHETGLIPVPNLNTFYSNGGQLNLIVPANHYDFSLPILSVMTAGDSRMN